MSAAAQVAPYAKPAARVVTNGWAKIPNSIIENMAVLTHAELMFALAIQKWGADGSAVKFTDDNWTMWTGLQVRQKYHAIAGLKKRNIISIIGRGEKQRYGFDVESWNAYIARTERALPRPTTTGRKKGVPPKVGQVVHPDCREQGCGRLAEQSCGLSLVPTSNLQPVANSNKPSSSKPTQQNQQVKASNLQPVAQTWGTAKAWELTLEAVRKPFKLAGVAFLARLVSACGAVFPDVTDQEIALAVEVAFKAKKHKQTDEGLFIFTVPEAIAANRNEKPVGPAPGITDGVAAVLERAKGALKSKGDQFTPHLAALERLEVLRDSTSLDLVRVDLEMQEIEQAIIGTAEKSLTLNDLAEIEREVQESMARIRAQTPNLTTAAFDDMRALIRGRQILIAAKLPRLGAFFE